MTAAVSRDWVRCVKCGAIAYGKRYRRDLRTCASCRHNGLMTAPERIESLADEGSVREFEAPSITDDPLHFTDTKSYLRRLHEAREESGLDEAVVCAHAAIGGFPVVLAVMDFRFMGGSLGRGVGERVTRAAEAAVQERVPLVIVTSSGGARMQEGNLALMQMVKTSQALVELDAGGVLTISVLTDPTYGGVAASFATLPDIILAEEGARTGFAGPRVVEQITGERLPESFQKAESLFRHGFVDAVLARRSIRSRIAAIVRTVQAPSETGACGPSNWLVTDSERLPETPAWDVVRMARKAGRPTTLDYANMLLDDFTELHGDRLGTDCVALVGGIGRLDGRPVMMIGHQKGRDTAERVARNFGMASPGGYRKAARLMRLAEKWRLPVITLIDTPGADPGIDAEEQGQAWAIADNLRLMSGLSVPIVSVVTGEGGSGGALALGVADRVYALSNAVYSVISPEGCASILWKRAEAAPRAAEALRLHAPELLRMGIIDAVIEEPGNGAHDAPLATAQLLRAVLSDAIDDLRRHEVDELLKARRNRFRSY
ncbi:MAG: acetyl-CoA carboxylase carboxyltransferase subunit alpha [Pseudonocardiales bacterium]|nr:acetyl-CoA carboxylase carboxyltransferase subunit alpha [Pseudonocardiales bacterium]